MVKKEKKGINIPNKITCVRLVLSFLVLFILCINWSEFGIEWKEWHLLGRVPISLKYIVCGSLFLIASVTDFLDGYIARKYNLVTDFGKVMDAIADKILVNGVLILLACSDKIPVLIPVIIITRDIIVDSIKMASGNKGHVVAASWAGKIKTVCMMIGVSLVFFSNLPFALIGRGLAVDDLFLFIATLMSVISACQYYWVNKDIIFSEM